MSHRTGFRGAVFTNIFFVIVMLSSIVIQVGRRNRFGRRTNVGTSLSQMISLGSPGEMFLSLLLLYNMRIIERWMGSSKYAMYFVFVTALGYGLERLATILWEQNSASGPYPLVFANIVGYVLEVPPSQTFTLFGMNMSDKMFVYLIGVQLLLSSGRRSIMAGACGILVGLLYHLDILGLQSLRLPRLIENLASNTARSFGIYHNVPNMYMASTMALRFNNEAEINPNRTATYLDAARNTVVGTQRIEASQENINQLVEMGFNADRAREALESAGNNVELALQSLL